LTGNRHNRIIITITTKQERAMSGYETSRTEHQVNSEILGLVNEGHEKHYILDRAVSLLAEYLRCDAIGIRVMDKHGNIPYETYKGFSDGFIKKENPLCIRHDRCACIEIAKGEYDPAVPLYTPYGSFFTNGLQGLEPIKDGMKTGRFRGECVRSGWESMALVPIRYGHRYFGLIHVVDGKKDSLHIGRVQFLENISFLLGIYMNAEDTQEENKKEFSSLANRIMHDLRNPLTSTKMCTELLATRYTDSTDPEINDYIGSISRNTDYMQQLITELGSFVQAYDQEKSVGAQVDLASLISTIVSDMRTVSSTPVEVKVTGPMPEVKYSPLCIKRILTNLISNAVKFSSTSDSPVVEVACEEKDIFYEVSVSDNGMGIDNSDVEKVFYPFYRAVDAAKIPGTGLGLSICKQLVEKNGGKIWVYSDKGKGSTFYFTIPK